MREAEVGQLTELELGKEIEELRRKYRELEERLSESEGTLKAIQSGEVDAILVSTPEGDRVFTLKGAEEPYRVLFEQMNEGAVTTSEEGMVLYSNRSFAEMLGVPLEKVIGTSFEDYVEASDRDLLFRTMERGRLAPVRTELTLVSADGPRVPVQLSISVLSSAGTYTYCMILADLSERVRAEETLQRSYEEVKHLVEERTRELSESEARYRSIYENSRDAILLLNAQGAVVGANPEACDMFAVSEGEILTMNKEDILFAPSPDHGCTDLMIESGNRLEHEYRRRWGGTFIGETTSACFTDADGSVITMLIIRDITDRKNAEAALLRSQANEATRRSELEALVDAVPALIWLSDGEGSAIVSNQASTEIFRPPLASSDTPMVDEYGRPSFKMFRGDKEVPPEEQPIHEVACTGKPCMETEFELRFNNGRSAWMYGNVVPLRTEDGSPGGAIGAFIDISEKKRAEARLVRSNEELQHFAYIASHDLQEPLRMVISYLGLLEKRYQDQLDDRGREYITIAVDGGKRMKALIDDLLEYSRIDTQGGDFALLDMNELVVQTLKLLEVGLRESNAVVEVEELPMVMGDKTQMIQVFQNLVGNAIKYRSAETPRISITASTSGNEYVFAVRDNGIGFKMEYADRILKMFQRLHTREEYPGTGVGLAITKRIVERHGGRMWAISEEGKGSTFYFALPKPQTGHTDD